MLQPVGRYQHGPHFWLRQVADDVEGLEFRAETLVLRERNHVKQVVVLAAVHRRGHGVQVQFAAQIETAALEGNLVGIDLGAQPAVAAKAQQGVCKAPGNEITVRGGELPVFELRGQIWA